jgi:hypothetical protein
MRIFKAEIADGLKDVLKDPSHGSLSWASPLEIVDMDEPTAYVNQSLAAMRAMGTNLNQHDLFYLRTILASVGWNKNDDCFMKDEVWAARNTAEDKPFNLGHDPNKIIGHITGSWPVDIEYNVIADDIAEEEIPDA